MKSWDERVLIRKSQYPHRDGISDLKIAKLMKPKGRWVQDDKWAWAGQCFVLLGGCCFSQITSCVCSGVTSSGAALKEIPANKCRQHKERTDRGTWKRIFKRKYFLKGFSQTYFFHSKLLFSWSGHSHHLPCPVLGVFREIPHKVWPCLSTTPWFLCCLKKLPVLTYIYNFI